MNGSEVVRALKRKLGVTTARELSKRLGVRVHSIYNWEKSKTVTAQQVARLVSKACHASQIGAIRPLVEFFRISGCNSKRGAKREVFENGDHPYRAGLREELKRAHGVYLFFDSRGHAIYAGKARRRHLWGEITNAFNRDRGGVQNIKVAKHPDRRVPYRSSNERPRQIREYSVPIHELASYFSAYEVDDAMIAGVEALLIRSFANDLLNIRMEHFAPRRKKKSS